MIYSQISAKMAGLCDAHSAIPPRVTVSIGEEPTDGVPSIQIHYQDLMGTLEPNDALALAWVVLHVLDEQQESEITLNLLDVSITVYRHEARAMALDLVYCAGMLQIMAQTSLLLVEDGVEKITVANVFMKALSLPLFEDGLPEVEVAEA